MSRKYVSTELRCRRICVIVHRSASDKLAVDSRIVVRRQLFVLMRQNDNEQTLTCFTDLTLMVVILNLQSG